MSEDPVVSAVLTATVGIVGLVGLVLVMAPPSVRAVEAWLFGLGLASDDPPVAAVRGVLVRMSYVGTVVFAIATAVAVLADFKMSSAALGLATAGALSPLVSAGGGRHRRVALAAPTGRDSVAVVSMIAGVVVGVGSMVLVAILEAEQRFRREEGAGAIVLDSGSALPAIESYTLPVLGVVAFLLSAIMAMGALRIRRRQALAAVDGSIDHALRAAQLHRLSFSVLGGQVVVAGLVCVGLPLIGGTGDIERMAAFATPLSLSLVAIGLALIAYSHLLPFWIARARASRQ